MSAKIVFFFEITKSFGYFFNISCPVHRNCPSAYLLPSELRGGGQIVPTLYITGGAGMKCLFSQPEYRQL